MKPQVRATSIIVLLCTIFIFVVGTVQARMYPGQDPPKRRIIKGLVTVRFEDNVDVNRAAKAFGTVSFGVPSLDPILQQYQITDFRKLFPWRTEKPPVNSGMHDLSRFYELQFPESVDVQEVINALQQNPNIRMAEPVWAIPLEAVPNDPLWSQQWAMEPPGPDPDYYDAWDIETGSDSIKYGCIDSGVNYKHRDLQGNIWVNPGEDLDGDGVVYDIDDLNGIDDDGNGRVDDLIGYDFFTGLGGGVWPGEDGGTPDPDPNDFDGHGTHVAGIAAAMNNNGLDVTSAAGGWYGGNRAYRGVQIMCLRVGATGADGLGYVNSNNCATAIDYAVMMGANVINASWGGSSVSAAAAANAVAAGVTFCHAAGNDNVNQPDEIDNVSGVLSVASVTSSDHKSSFSNYGFWIDVSAPGSNILSTYSNQYSATTATLSGTSMASPMVAGLALLIRSAMPSLTRDQVDSLIVFNADPIDSINPSYQFMLGSGRINAFKALSGLASAKFTADVTEGNVPLTVQFTDLSPYSPTSWQWTFGTGDGDVVQNPVYTYTTPGIYDVSLIVDDTSSLGPGEEHLKHYIWARADTLTMDSQEVASASQVVVPVYLANTAQISEIMFAFQLDGHNGTVSFDSASVVGLRTEYFYSVLKVASDQNNERFAIKMTTDATGTGSHYLQPDTGAILNLYVTVSSGASPGQLVTIDTMTVSGNKPRITTIWGDYWPDFYVPGKLAVRVCAHGDCNCDGEINVTDITVLVNYLFQFGTPPDGRGGDVNGVPPINISDLTYLVDYLFNSGPPPPP